MNFENEITVEVDMSFDSLDKLLKSQNFKIVDDFVINDVYLTKKNINKLTNYLDILKSVVLIRSIILSNKEINEILYKYKEFDKYGNILRQGKKSCIVESVNDAIDIFKCLKYKELLKIKNVTKVYSNGIDELCVQLVDDKHIYIEVEDECTRLNKKYSSLEEMKSLFEKYNIKIIENEYFAKKALVALKEKYLDK